MYACNMYMKVIALCIFNLIFHQVYDTLMLSPGTHTNVHEGGFLKREKKKNCDKALLSARDEDMN